MRLTEKGPYFFFFFTLRLGSEDYCALLWGELLKTLIIMISFLLMQYSIFCGWYFQINETSRCNRHRSSTADTRKLWVRIFASTCRVMPKCHDHGLSGWKSCLCTSKTNCRSSLCAYTHCLSPFHVYSYIKFHRPNDRVRMVIWVEFILPLVLYRQREGLCPEAMSPTVIMCYHGSEHESPENDHHCSGLSYIHLVFFSKVLIVFGCTAVF